MIQRLNALTAAVPLIPNPQRLIRPPVATSAIPTIRALEWVELIWMRVSECSVLVMPSPDVSLAQLTSLPDRDAAESPATGDVTPASQASPSAVQGVLGAWRGGLG